MSNDFNKNRENFLISDSTLASPNINAPFLLRLRCSTASSSGGSHHMEIGGLIKSLPLGFSRDLTCCSNPKEHFHFKGENY